MSPQRIYCNGCRASLYSGFELEIPQEVLQRNNGVCPSCGKKLEFGTDNLIIVPNVYSDVA